MSDEIVTTAATTTTIAATTSITTKKTRRTYTINQKLAAIEYVSKHGMKPSCRDLNIGLTTIRRWHKELDHLKSLVTERSTNGINPAIRQRKLYSGSCATISKDIEEQLIQYMKQQINDYNKKITMDIVVRYIRQIDPKLIIVKCMSVRKRLLRIFHRRNIIVPTTKQPIKKRKKNKTRSSKIIKDKALKEGSDDDTTTTTVTSEKQNNDVIIDDDENDSSISNEGKIK